MKKLLFLLLILFYPPIAASEIFHINEYNIDLSLKKNGEINVKEEIIVNESSSRKIIKTIPLNYKDIKGIKRTLKIYDLKVTGESFSTKKEGGFFYIIIETARSLPSPKKYYLQYTLYDTVVEMSDSDFLHLNFDINGLTKIDKLNLFIFLPKKYAIKDEDIKVILDKPVNKDTLLSLNTEEGMIYIKSNKPLISINDLSIIVALPKNLIKDSLITKSSLLLKENSIFAIPIFLFFTLLVVWYFIGKDERVFKVVHYKPPKDLNPAIAGYLFNDKADNRDLISLLFYWAKDGIISIEEVDDPLSIFASKKDYLIKQIKPLPLEAKPFEWVIFNNLFPYQIRWVRVSSLKNKFYTTMDLARKNLETYISDLNLYHSSSLTMGKILKVLFIPFLLAGLYTTKLGDIKLAFSLILSALVILTFSLIMPKKTKEGNRIYEILLGFKNFLEKVEKPRLEKMISKNPEYFNEILPYAVAFGIADKFANKFEGLFSKPPEWYSRGDRAFTLGDFLSALNLMSIDIKVIFKE